MLNNAFAAGSFYSAKWMINHYFENGTLLELSRQPREKRQLQDRSISKICLFGMLLALLKGLLLNFKSRVSVENKAFACFCKRASTEFR